MEWLYHEPKFEWDEYNKYCMRRGQDIDIGDMI